MGERSVQPRSLTITVAVVKAYLASTAVAPEAVGRLIRQVHEVFVDLEEGRDPAQWRPPELMRQRPLPTREEIAASITEEALVSFEDGKRYHMLKRHLTQRNLTPKEYRKKWGLPLNYPMVAPHYTRKRAELALRNRLGHADRKAAEQASKAERPAEAESETGRGGTTARARPYSAATP